MHLKFSVLLFSDSSGLGTVAKALGYSRDLKGCLLLLLLFFFDINMRKNGKVNRGQI